MPRHASGGSAASVATTDGLTIREQVQLQKVLQRAHEFEKAEDMDLMRQPMEGFLMKFTNVMTGWQNRWFVLDPHAGKLTYYLKPEHKSANKARGVLQLSGAMVDPSEDDPLAFTVVPNIAGQESYKLKAGNTKQRQMWINRIRVASDDHQKERLNKAMQAVTKAPQVSDQIRRGTARETAVLHQLHKVLAIATDQHASICRQIDALPTDQNVISSALVVKAVSHSLLDSLEQCQNVISHMAVTNDLRTLHVDQQQQPKMSTQTSNMSTITTTTTTTTSKSIPPTPTSADIVPLMLSKPIVLGQPAERPLHVVPDNVIEELQLYEDDEVEDGILYGAEVTGDENEDEDEPMEVEESPIGSTELCQHDQLSLVDVHKAQILSLVSRLKLGTDLTKISLPTYVLQSRSLLECLSNAFANTPLLLSITDQPTAEQRMLHFVKWYLTSFTAVCQNGEARKPYNPILGEIFQCLWSTGRSAKPSVDDPVLKCHVEQVSHHPPVSCIYANSDYGGLHLSAYVMPRVKFMGMSIASNMVGHGRLTIGTSSKHGPEEYTFTYPNVFGRSIVSTPWFELTGKCQLACQPSGCTATVTFHEKPFYGGKIHRVTADVKNADGTLFASVNGEWNGQLNITLASGDISTLDVRHASAGVNRIIRPVQQQMARESRRLWAEVTKALQNDDDQTATAQRNKIVQAQRRSLGKEQVYESRYFYAQPDAKTQWLAKQYPIVFCA